MTVSQVILAYFTAVTVCTRHTVYISTDLGATWPMSYEAEWPSRWQHTTLADLDNFVYVVSGELDRGHQERWDSSIWFSSDKALSWNQLPSTNAASIIDPCVAIRYIVESKVLIKQIIMYSGLSDYVGDGSGVIQGNITSISVDLSLI